MSWFNNLSFRYKLLLPLAILAVLVVVLGSVSYVQSNKLAQATKVLSDSIIPKLDKLISADRDIYQALSAERSILFMNVKDEAFPAQVEFHKENVQQVGDRIKAIKDVVDDQQTLAAIDSIIASHARWKSLSHEVVSLRAANTRQGRRDAVSLSFGAAADAFDDVRGQIDVLVEKTATQVDVMEGETDQQISATQSSVLTVTLIAVVICVGVAIVFPPMVLGPINRMIGYTDDLAEGSGDLTRRIRVKSEDELGHLSSGFNAFLNNLQNLINQVKTTAMHVHDGMDNVSALSDRSKHSVADQQAQIEMVATAMNEMVQSIHEVAQNAEQARMAAEKANSEAEGGLHVVNDTSSSINQLADEVVNASGVIEELQGAIGNIGAVLGVIRGIAEQTNLLALNAAIEAARAGEQGRGFAVVADEVRALASRTQQSTEEIQDMIQTLENKASKATQVMESGRSKAEASVEKASRMNEVLDTINTAVSEINNMNAQIASAAEEQSSVSDEISTSITSINDLASDTSKTSEEGADALNSMSSQITGLSDLVKQFKTQ